ncbi:MAG: excinuclease ABC subunit UvrB [Lentisphaeria bacterium]|nr:excinuclease ABC subunit UvrB [Lentisphaeria bacterium]
MSLFKLHSDYKLSGDQQNAFRKLTSNLEAGKKFQTLQGITGSGKTFTLANVISTLDRPVLVISHNKTLAAQLYSEFKSFFPENAVEYFISYYDYYLPESYIPQTDTYIAKDASINENIERLRLSASSSLTERRDCIVVASVSCIYGLGSPEDYANMCIDLKVGGHAERNDILKALIDIQYNRNDTSPGLGEFRVRGDSIDVFEPQREEFVRISFWGDEIESIDRFNAVSGKLKNHAEKVTLFPCKHFVLPKSRIDEASGKIMQEMRERVEFFEKNGKLVEAQRLSQRVRYDLEMMQEIGYCSGIENYSMHLAGRTAGTRPYTLFDFFPKGFLTIIDESHVTLPQLNAMYKADRNRKTTLIEHGFRLQSALENRPMRFNEIEDAFSNVIFVSATPGEYEAEHSSEIIPQIIRPTGLLDPEVTVRPLANQIDEAIELIRSAAEKKERTLVTTLTKKGAERLSDYLSELNVKVSYIHSELDALERVQVLTKLKKGEFDCVIGINLLREGIDLPEVAQVLILDADKEGFLRSARSLIQVAGRAARNANGRVVLFGDRITDSMQILIDTTAKHRAIQIEYNKKHNITPKTVIKSERVSISEVVQLTTSAKAPFEKKSAKNKSSSIFDAPIPDEDIAKNLDISPEELNDFIKQLEAEMLQAAEALEFEHAADLRDQIRKLQKKS